MITLQVQTMPSFSQESRKTSTNKVFQTLIQIMILFLTPCLYLTGLQDLDENVSESDLKEMKVESIKRDFVERQANSTSGRLIGGSIRMACNEATELACQDGLMCYPINKKCDRWSDCIMDR